MFKTPSHRNELGPEDFKSDYAKNSALKRLKFIQMMTGSQAHKNAKLARQSPKDQSYM